MRANIFRFTSGVWALTAVGFAAVGTAAMATACSASDEGATVDRGRPSNGTGASPGLTGEPGAGGTGSNSDPNLGMSLGTADPPTTEETGCGLEMFDLRRRPANVLLVLDRSGSMKESPDEDTATTSKWDLTVPALNQVILGTDTGVSWGMKVFPDGDGAGECSAASITDAIVVPIADKNATNVVNTINITTPEGDGTPTGDAVNSAVRYLTGLANDDKKYIVLATDGEPSCSPGGGGDSARAYAVQAVTAAAAAGIPVFVVGVATTKDTAMAALNAMAVAGGGARKDPNPLATRYYLANTQAELVQSLQAITGELATCVFPLGSRPPVPENIGVKVNGVLVPRDPARADGWEYVGTDFRSVEVHGHWCNDIQTAAADTVQIIFACEGFIIK